MSVVELLVTLAIIGIVVTTAALSLRPLQAPLHSGVAQLEGFIQRSRTAAMSTTSAYRLTPSGSGRITAQFSASCSAATWTDDPAISLQFPEGVRMSSTTWSLCFDPRGLPSANLTIALTHSQFGTRSVEVMLGGATRILP